MTEITLDEAKERLTKMIEWLNVAGSKVTNAAELMESTISTVASTAKIGEAIDISAAIATEFKSFDDKMKKLRAEVAKMKEVHLPNRLDDEGVTTFNTDTFRVTRSARTFASIIAQDKEDAFEWLRNNDYGGLIKPTVNSSSLSGAAKELMENGQELPDDLFKTHVKDNVSITIKKAARGS